ncbi:protein-disulfide reductase DsbD family protein [Natronogracilivirga saccharolytica]|uniref:Thioredoxin family protein n=1 Tax=Natronogracilivirga saccharolytica TaxID=2812953 RepID=A0A8J7RML8_9BACT|nr:cytochrome c biogenesis protein CcdA [Natronogracilivirga saccharolytica]MBP3192514.1 thioredoxin family protein [Natronogracilivirga saccharolytica]
MLTKVRPLFLLLALFVITAGLFQDSQAQLRGSSEKVDVETYLSKDVVPRGSTFRVAVMLDIADGWHVNAHQPTLDYLIGTEVKLETHDRFILSDIRYPEPDKYEFAFAGGEDLLVYGGKVPVYLDIRASSGLETGTHKLTGHVRAQACDDQNCLAPSNLPLEIEFEVVDGEHTAQEINQDVFDQYDAAASGADASLQPQSPNEIEALFEDRGIILAFLALFLIGLALNLTPCVYPMLSVTVSIFGGQNDPNMLRVFSKAVVYVLGIATMYSVLGVLASFSGELFGSWLQHPWVLAGIGLLLFGLALSMFGLYEIQVPYWLASRLGTGNSTGFVGTYFSGLVVGVFAAPCIGPPIIALLAFIGSQGDPVFGFWSFFILSLGLGLPYLILGTFSGLLPKLPKSGVWMIWVKKVFGVVLVALALFYLAMPFMPVSDAFWVVPLAFIIGGVYLGFLESSGKETPYFSKLKKAFGALAVVAGIFFFMNLQKDGIQWESFDQSRLAEARESGNPVVLDFYADWCIPCLELERITFTDSRVVDATDDMVRMKVDLTQFDSPESEELRREFDVAGVPTIVFLDEQGNEVADARVVGFVGPDEFISRVNKVKQ